MDKGVLKNDLLQASNILGPLWGVPQTPESWRNNAEGYY